MFKYGTWPIPEVPPTKRAVGVDVICVAALSALAAASVGIVEMVESDDGVTQYRALRQPPQCESIQLHNPESLPSRSRSTSAPFDTCTPEQNV